ncbi:MAG: hypothetical protein ACRDPD_24160, partial [Streptosporangiaceae bacterium]
MSRLEERRRRWEAEQERQHAEDLAQAERIGADFGLGELRTTGRYRQARSGRIAITGMFVAIAGLVAGVAFGAAGVRYTLAGAVAAAAASAGAVLLGVQLMRTGLQTRAVRRLFWYSGGLAQQDRDEPEPHVLVGAYDAGEPVAAGRWRIGQAGLTRIRGNSREDLLPWRDICTLEHRRDCELTIGLGGRRRRTISLADVPNGMFIVRLIEYAVGQHEIP